jgi:aminoglycoside phosphotransferase family enzyme
MSSSSQLIQSLQNPALFPHKIASFQVIETHISWILLTGSYAYKIKKSLNLGFLDFSSLEKRKHYCHEELRLNSRLAPDIYLDVVAITGTEDQPTLDGSGGCD